MAQHALGDIQRHAIGVRKAVRQRTREIAGTAAQIEPASGAQAGGQPLDQGIADRALQLGDRIVAGRRAGKRRRDLALVG